MSKKAGGIYRMLNERYFSLTAHHMHRKHTHIYVRDRGEEGLEKAERVRGMTHHTINSCQTHDKLREREREVDRKSLELR